MVQTYDSCTLLTHLGSSFWALHDADEWLRDQFQPWKDYPLIEGVTQKLHIFVACSILTWALARPTIFIDFSLAAQTLDSVSSSRIMPTYILMWGLLMIQTSLPVSGQLHTILQEFAMFLLDFVGASLTSRLSVVLRYETVLHVTLSPPLELLLSSHWWIHVIKSSYGDEWNSLYP